MNARHRRGSLLRFAPALVLACLATRVFADATRGERLFNDERTRCSVCHSVDGTHALGGPDLLGSTEKFDRAGLLRAIREPSADLLPGYDTVLVVSSDGTSHQGILRRVGRESLELVDATGESIRIRRDTVLTQKISRTSLMPEGLLDELSATEVDDLLLYLQTLVRPTSEEKARPELPRDVPRALRPLALRPLHPPEHEFHRPVWFGPLPGRPGNFIVAEVERARLWRVDPEASGEQRRTLFADLSAATRHGYVEGLLGVAFHPDFERSRRYFVKMHAPDRDAVVVEILEFRASEDGLRDSGLPPRRLLRVPMPHVNHNGGHIVFGPDGFLYVGFGDGGPQEDPNGYSQDLGSLLGKILRLEVDRAAPGTPYGIPDDNPFLGRRDARPEIWALGFREPWRFSFDRESGELWLGDVGQNRFEEVSIVRRGENHGWNVVEGFAAFSGRYRRAGEDYVEPIVSYSRQHGVSVTGGFVYRGREAPLLRGLYIFGDFESRRIWGLRRSDGRLEQLIELGRSPSRIASFGEDADGELYLVGHDPGVIYRLDLRDVDLRPARRREVLASSEAAPVLWRHTTDAPEEGGWMLPEFDDSGWNLAPGGFGTSGTPGAVVRTEWRGRDIWLRRAFDLSEEELAGDRQSLYLRIHHDEDAEVYVNGVLAASPRRWQTAYVDVPLGGEAVDALRAGRNLLAIHCRQSGGGQYIDAGLVRFGPQDDAGVPPPANPADHLPPHIERLTYFGERADWSHDGKRILFLSKTFGDAMEVEMETRRIRNLTSHYPHHGYTRALYLSNGDILLSGPVSFDPERTREARVQCSLFVLKRDLSSPALPLGTKCSEGPAVSRKRLHIAWTHVAAQYPEEMAPGSSRIVEADLAYGGEGPRLESIRTVLDSRDLPFRATLEAQNFRPTAETELTFSAYGYQGTEVCSVNLETKSVTNVSNAPEQYDEPEGIFPDGRHTLVECDRHNHGGPGRVDLWKLDLDGGGYVERLTFFSDSQGYKASNPVVSDDGRFIAFQLARTHEAAGVGHGIFVLDVEAAKKAKRDAR